MNHGQVSYSLLVLISIECGNTPHHHLPSESTQLNLQTWSPSFRRLSALLLSVLFYCCGTISFSIFYLFYFGSADWDLEAGNFTLPDMASSQPFHGPFGGFVFISNSKQKFNSLVYPHQLLASHLSFFSQCRLCY